MKSTRNIAVLALVMEKLFGTITTLTQQCCIMCRGKKYLGGATEELDPLLKVPSK